MPVVTQVCKLYCLQHSHATFTAGICSGHRKWLVSHTQYRSINKTTSTCIHSENPRSTGMLVCWIELSYQQTVDIRTCIPLHVVISCQIICWHRFWTRHSRETCVWQHAEPFTASRSSWLMFCQLVLQVLSEHLKTTSGSSSSSRALLATGWPVVQACITAANASESNQHQAFCLS